MTNESTTTTTTTSTHTQQEKTTACSNQKKAVKRFSGYKRVKKSIEWKQVYNYKDSKKSVGWYNPSNNEVRWNCFKPDNHIKYVWESTAELATHVKPVQMGKSPSWREPDERMC